MVGRSTSRIHETAKFVNVPSSARRARPCLGCWSVRPLSFQPGLYYMLCKYIIDMAYAASLTHNTLTNARFRSWDCSSSTSVAQTRSCMCCSCADAGGMVTACAHAPSVVTTAHSGPKPITTSLISSARTRGMTTAACCINSPGRSSAPTT
ncbi:hypothetical protein BDW22DRAFT_784123 [Trametopsis cervina]|nr:hypothetical protein BDW22DRAFT_784123 [Trametopsis cervina]